MPAEPETAAPKKLAPRGPTFGQQVSSFLLYLLELFLPAILAGGIVAWLFTNYRLWALGRMLSQVLFVLAVVLLTFMLAVVLDMFTAGMRASQRLLGGGPRLRMVKFALGGVIVPLALAISALVVILPTGGTALAAFISAVQGPVQVAPPDVVGDSTLQAENLSLKLTGIEVLTRLNSTEALTQLVRLLKEDRSLLSSATGARALAKAIASYGIQVRDPLLALFQEYSAGASSTSSALPDDLYGRYFSESFDSLEAEVTSSDPARLDQVKAAQAQLQAALENIHAASLASAPGDPRLDFILQTFLAMNVSQDADLLAFAKRTAADARFSNGVRGDALLLVGKLGWQADMDGLYPYLKNSDDVIRIRAMQAISAILAKNTPAPK
jgi:hypothetical protein